VFGAVTVRTAERAERRASAVLHFIKDDVVLACFRSNDVIVVCVAVALDEPGRLVDAARERLEAHGDLAVHDFGGIVDGKREAARRAIVG